ncbi:MAG: hypothetical protein A2Z93_03615 [Curvibacter sp. GWA2_64_110]|nr:MAG: hypothetical protein A2Z93_03615 [Curvibacter sp. GWA2_64_110]HCY15342.1 hypothetical protein [Curvibacter sp.]
MEKVSTLFKWCFLGYLAILPMSDTIALRNLLLLVLVCIVLACLVLAPKRSKLPLSNGFRLVPWILALWALYLFVFPLFAVQADVAWQNLKGQWIESLLAWLVGFGAVMLLGRQGPSLWALALASAFPLAIHLSLCLFGWVGLLGEDYQSLDTLGGIWHAFSRQLHTGFEAVGKWRDFPLGFRGIEPMHGNLGYAACQAIALFGICFFLAWRERNQRRLYLATLAIAICFSSILIARSRGAVLFALLVLLVTGAVYRFRWSPVSMMDSGMKKTGPLSIKWSIGVIGALCMLILVAYQSVRHDARWHSMMDKVQLGLFLENPLDILCEGLPLEVESRIRDQLADHSPDYIDDVLGGLKGQDGGRLLLMRAGLGLVFEHPNGLDGSRQSYQKLMENKCGHTPRLHFAHSHQSWIDLSLALGWVGVLLFAGVMFYFMRQGWRSMENSNFLAFGTALFLLSAFWITRGMVDSVYREHYLQMQAVLLAYAYWRIQLAKGDKTFSVSPSINLYP